MATVQQVDHDGLEAALKNDSTTPLLVDFYAPWYVFLFFRGVPATLCRVTCVRVKAGKGLWRRLTMRASGRVVPRGRHTALGGRCRVWDVLCVGEERSIGR